MPIETEPSFSATDAGATISVQPDFVVNQLGAGIQAQPVITALSGGGFAATWWTEPVNGTDSLVGRLFNADGTPAGDEFTISDNDGFWEDALTMAALPDGGFIVAWRSDDANASDNNLVRVRVFDENGTAQGSDFIANATSAGGTTAPSIDVLESGGFVVTWHASGTGSDGDSYAIRGHLFDADGNAAEGDDFLINTTTSGYQQDVVVKALPGGGFVAVWESSDGGDGAGYNAVRGRVFDASGSPVGDDFLVNTTATGNQQDADVTVLPDGRFVVTWETNDGGDGAGYGIRARIFEADGSSAGDDFIVNTAGTSNQTDPAITDLPDGGFVIAWTSNDGEEGGSTAIRARIFDASGAPTGSDFIVNTTTATGQSNVGIDTLASGEVVFSWFSGDGGDGDGYLVRGRVLDLSNGAPPSNIKLDGNKISENAAVDAVVGTLSATDAEGGALTYTLADDAGGLFSLVTSNGETKLVVAGALDYQTAPSHDVVIEVADEDGNVVSQTFTIDVKPPMITIDASTATSGMDFEAFIRGGFLAGTSGGGFPVFDHGSAFAGEEMVIGFGTDASSKYVLAHGFLEYYFGTHTVYGEIGTIEYGTFGSGTYDANGYLTGSNVELRITGLDLANPIPANPTEEAEIEATGAVHNFAVSHMYGASADQARLDLYAEQIDGMAQNFIGSAYNDVYTGTGFDDVIAGGNGNDVLAGGGGNDAIDGGAGTDIAYFDGNFVPGSGTYTLTPGMSGAPTTITDSRAEGGTGTDTLTNVEIVRFNNLTLNLTNFSINYTPTDLALDDAEVSSDAAIGDLVGTLQVTDQEAGDTHTFELIDDAEGRFILNGSSVEVAGELAAGDYMLRARVTDSAGNVFEKELTIAVTGPENAAPAINVDANLTFTHPTVGIPNDGIYADAQAVDVDGDGDLDIAVVNRSQNRIDVYTNDGEGNISGTAISTSTSNLYNAAFADVDGDGVIDAVTTHYDAENTANGQVIWQKGNGDGTFGSAQTLAGGMNNPYNVLAVDFDGDGDVDILTAVMGDSNNLTFSENDGNGNFTSSTLGIGVPGPYVVRVADINGDGLLDVVNAGSAGKDEAGFTSGARINVSINNGDGTFETTTIDGGTQQQFFDVEVADLDGDGELDLVAANPNVADSIVWYKGNGDGTFGDALSISTQPNGRTSIAVGDIDGDGDTDIAAMEGSEGASNPKVVSWFENDGGGNFTEHKTGLYINNEGSVELADLNGDGLLDIIRGGRSGATSATRNTADVMLASKSIQVTENATSPLSSISFSDDTTGASVTVTLSVASGTLTAESGAGVTVSGDGTGTLTLTGSLADINAFLAGEQASFLTEPNTESDVPLTITISDGMDGDARTTSTTVILDVEPFVGEPPTDLALDGSTVSENAAVGTIVGTLSASDPEGGALSYVLTDSAGGKFALSTDGGGTRLIVNGALDYESADGHQVTVTVTDSDGNSTSQVFDIAVGNVDEAPENLALSNASIAEDATVGAVVGTLSATDPENAGAITYALTDDADGLFELVGNEIRVKSALDYETATGHEITVTATDATGQVTTETLTIAVGNVDEGGEQPAMITIDASAAISGMNFEAFIRGGFVSDTTGGGFPVFDNGSAFEGEEMFIGYGSDAASKYVLMHGELEYYFGTHTVAGTANTIEYGTRGSGSYDADGYFSGGDVELRITGLDLSNPIPTNSTEEQEIEANGPIHNFAVAHMYGAATGSTQARYDKFADSLDAYAQHFIGSAYDDVYTGTIYDDIIEGGGGNDSFDGGAGEDKIVFAGAYAGYSLVKQLDGSVIITEAASGKTTTVSKIELAEFSDKSIDLETLEEVIDNTAPTGLSLSASDVEENSASGTVIGILSATDADNDTLSYMLTDNGGGKFSIVTENGVARLVVNGDLDYETATSHLVTVKVSDGNGGETSENFTINVTDVIETISGTSGKDKLVGSYGADLLSGGKGKDVLKGGAGDDIVDGGKGIDKLYGGAGADTFVFEKGDTGKTRAKADTIFDFKPNDGDIIDLSDWDANSRKGGDQDFTFIGSQGFHGKAGELRFVKEKSDTWIMGDTNGDGKADFMIHLDDAMKLKVDHFDL